MSPAQGGQLRCDSLLLSALRFYSLRGMRCALGMIKLKGPENMKTQKGCLLSRIYGLFPARGAVLAYDTGLFP